MTGMQVLEVIELGCPAWIIKTTDDPILLIDAALEHDDRIAIMAKFLDGDEDEEEVDDD